MMTETTGTPRPPIEVEYVDKVPPVPKARVQLPEIPEAHDEPVEKAADTPRQRDYLSGFLAGSASEKAADTATEDLKERIITALRDIFDPEIPVNIYDLGLIYGVDITDGHVDVKMTLTTPHCPVAESMPGEVELRVMSVPGVATCDVNLVWNPPWSPDNMSDEARLELGML